MEEFHPFSCRQNELSVDKGCLLWWSPVVIPSRLQQVLEALHVSQPGVLHMKALARSYFWWAKMDKTIEEWVRSCQMCQESRPLPEQAPVHPWEVA